MMNDDEWNELMGPHLIIKTLNKSSSSSLPKSSNNNDDEDDTDTTDNPVFPEVGDAIILRVEGRILGSDNDYNFASSDGSLKDASTSSNVYMLSSPQDEWMITMCDGDVLPAIEMACRFTHSGQTCLVRCHSKYAHGTHGVSSTSSKYFQQSVPPNTCLEFLIEIKQIVPSTKFDRQLNLRRVCAKKEMSTELYFKNQQYSRSIQLYQSAIKIIKYQLLLNAEDEGESTNNNKSKSDDSQVVKQLLVDCLNNVALCYMKLNEFTKAKNTLTELLQLDPNNLKALCRAIKCTMQLGEYKEAHELLKVADERIAVDQLKQTNMIDDIKKLKEELRQHELSYKKKEKQMYQKMMTSGNKKQQQPHPSTMKGRPQQQQQQIPKNDDKANLVETHDKKTNDKTTTTKKTDDEPLLPLQDLELSFRNPQFVILVVSLVLALIVTKLFQIYVENNIFVVDKKKPS